MLRWHFASVVSCESVRKLNSPASFYGVSSKFHLHMVRISLLQFPRHWLGLMVKHLSPMCQAPGATLNPSKNVKPAWGTGSILEAHVLLYHPRCDRGSVLSGHTLSRPHEDVSDLPDSFRTSSRCAGQPERRRDRPRRASFSLRLYWLPEIGHAHHSLWGPVGMGSGQDSTSPVPLESPCPRCSSHHPATAYFRVSAVKRYLTTAETKVPAWARVEQGRNWLRPECAATVTYPCP